jgi:tRNA A-37 threonylcarbamoyl transferase component Bud32
MSRAANAMQAELDDLAMKYDEAQANVTMLMRSSNAMLAEFDAMTSTNAAMETKLEAMTSQFDVLLTRVDQLEERKRRLLDDQGEEENFGNNKSKGSGGAIGIGVGVAAVVIIALATTVVVLRRERTSKRADVAHRQSMSKWEQPVVGEGGNRGADETRSAIKTDGKSPARGEGDSAYQINKVHAPNTHAEGATAEQGETIALELLYQSVGVSSGKPGNSQFNATQDGMLYHVPYNDAPNDDTAGAGNSTLVLSAPADVSNFDTMFYETPTGVLPPASTTAHALESSFKFNAGEQGTKQFDDSKPANIYSAVREVEPCVNGPSGRQLSPAISRDNIDLISRLGSGAFGDVWKAKLDESSSPGGRPGYLVAVKMVKEGAPESERLELLNEAALMAQLSGEGDCHPNVISLVGLVDDGAGATLAVITYCEHGSLEKYLETHGPTGALDVAFRIGVGGQVAGGMSFLARCGVVHRDLAARNVLLDSRKKARVADFGMSRFSSSTGSATESIYAVYETGENSIVRIPVRWSAPEVFDGYRFSTSSDVWSFAMLMIEVFTDGAPPFSGTPQSQVFPAVVAGARPTQPLLCPDLVFKVLRQCWSADPQQRPSFKILELQFEGLAKKNNLRGKIDTERGRHGGQASDEAEGYLCIDGFGTTVGKVPSAKVGGDEGYDFRECFNAAIAMAPSIDA